MRHGYGGGRGQRGGRPDSDGRERSKGQGRGGRGGRVLSKCVALALEIGDFGDQGAAALECALNEFVEFGHDAVLLGAHLSHLAGGAFELAGSLGQRLFGLCALLAERHERPLGCAQLGQ